MRVGDGATTSRKYTFKPPQSTALPAPLNVSIIGRPMVAPTEMRGALRYGTKKGRRGRRPVRKISSPSFMYVGAIIGRPSSR